MTTKFDAFITELKALCEKHQVSLDSGYENIKVYPFPMWKGDTQVFNTYFEDYTDWSINNE